MSSISSIVESVQFLADKREMSWRGRLCHNSCKAVIFQQLRQVHCHILHQPWLRGFEWDVCCAEGPRIKPECSRLLSMWISWRFSVLPNGFENIRLNLGDAGFISCITSAERLPWFALTMHRGVVGE